MQPVQWRLGVTSMANGFKGDGLINKLKGISIEWQELFPIVIACTLWHKENAFMP